MANKSEKALKKATTKFRNEYLDKLSGIIYGFKLAQTHMIDNGESDFLIVPIANRLVELEEIIGSLKVENGYTRPRELTISYVIVSITDPDTKGNEGSSTEGRLITDHQSIGKYNLKEFHDAVLERIKFIEDYTSDSYRYLFSWNKMREDLDSMIKSYSELEAE